jgi:TonB-linked SusC/RagA family outer membrane protein
MKLNLLGKSSRLLLLMLVTFFMFCGKAFAQNTIRGIVLDNNNQPLPGVTIKVKGTTRATITNVGGRFTFAAGKGEVLVISEVGFITQELTVTSDVNYSIQMQQETKNLNEVVVTALGVKKEFQKLGYSQSQVNGDELTVARDPNPLNSMVGKVAGLTIGASNEMFSAPQVVLRGSMDILYVVDGEPVESNTFDYNPDDVDTYTVLKGPNAAALYGFRGINGAIIITTKKGTKDKKGWQIDYNSTTEFEKGFLALPQDQYEYGRGTNYTYSYGNQLYDNNQRLPEWGPQFDGQPVQQFDSPYNPVTGVRGTTPWTARGIDNFNNFVQTGITSTNSLSLAASGQNYDIRVSYGHTYQKGDFPNTSLNIDNFKIASGYDVNPKLRVDADLNLNLQYSPNVPDATYGPNSYIYEFFVYGSSDYPINELKNIYQGPQGVPNLVQYAQEYGRENNPWFQAEKWLRGRNNQTINGSLSVTYKFTNDLNVKLRTALDNYNDQNTEDVPSSANLNQYLPWYYFGWYGDYRQDDRNLLENNTDISLNYHHNFHGFDISALAGANERSFRYLSDWASTQDLLLPNVYNLNNSANPDIIYNFDSRMQVNSGYYSVDFGYKNYFNINTTGRVDNTSTLGKSFFYPSASISTVVTDWARLPETISFLKLRASYADVKGAFTSATIGTSYNAFLSTANGGGFNLDPVSNLLGYGSEYYTPYNGPNYENQASSAASKIYNGTSSVVLSNSIPDKNIQPYDVKSAEFGFDAKFLQNRLGLNATYFTTQNGPNIFSLPLAPSTTDNSQIVNGLTTQKNGIELELVGSPLRSKDGLNWTVNANYSTYRETLKSVGNGQNGIYQNGHYYTIGERLDDIYGTKFVRDAQGAIVYSGGEPLQAPGQQDNANYGFLGHADPDFAFGITNTFSYKGFTLSFQFDGRIGGKIYDYTWYHAMNGGTAIETAEGALGAARAADWTSFEKTGQVANNGQGSYIGQGVVITSGTPVYGPGGTITNLNQLTFAPNTTPVTTQAWVSSGLGSNFDEYYMISRSYAKLREATLGYSLPEKMLQGSFIKKVTFSIVGRNLLYFAARKDIDLDEYASGYDASTRSLVGYDGSTNLTSPTARRFGINLHLTF